MGSNKRSERSVRLHTTVTTVIIFVMVFVAQTAQAALVGLGLVIDGSGSITASDFSLQKTAYASVLGNSPVDGSVAIGLWQFSSTVNEEFAFTVIDSVATRNLLVNAVNGMAQLSGNTGIGDGIVAADTALRAADATLDFSRVVIDVSTDGFNNIGVDPSLSATSFVNYFGGLGTPIQAAANCLGIGVAPFCGFRTDNGLGFDNFEVLATFLNIETQFKFKIETETGLSFSAVPIPGAVWLFASGLMGLIGVGKSRRKV